VTALLIGTAMALIAVGVVLFPLFRDDTGAPSPPAPRRPHQPPTNLAVVALREIEFDRETGKLSDADYQALKAQYTGEALEAMRVAESAAAAAAPEPIAGVERDLAEEAILRYRRPAMSCTSCGPRPEPDALYCSNCGRFLSGRCSDCGSPVTDPGARFCSECGKTLAA
jgi:hypothetical protein